LISETKTATADNATAVGVDALSKMDEGASRGCNRIAPRETQRKTDIGAVQGLMSFEVTLLGCPSRP